MGETLHCLSVPRKQVEITLMGEVGGVYDLYPASFDEALQMIEGIEDPKTLRVIFEASLLTMVNYVAGGYSKKGMMAVGGFMASKYAKHEDFAAAHCMPLGLNRVNDLFLETMYLMDLDLDEFLSKVENDLGCNHLYGVTNARMARFLTRFGFHIENVSWKPGLRSIITSSNNSKSMLEVGTRLDELNGLERMKAGLLEGSGVDVAVMANIDEVRVQRELHCRGVRAMKRKLFEKYGLDPGNEEENMLLELTVRKIALMELLKEARLIRI